MELDRFKGTVYDFNLHYETMKIIPWMKDLEKFTFDPKVSIFNILVPTKETVSCQSILGLLGKE